MDLRRHAIGLILGLTLMAACSKNNTPPPLEEDMLYLVECINQEYPDSALRILDTLNISVLSEKEKAHYCLMKALINFHIRKNTVEADSLLEIAKNHYLGCSDKYHEALTYWIVSDRAEMTNKGDQVVLDNRLKALQSIDQCHHIDERLVRFSPIPIDEQSKIDGLKYSIHLRVGMSYASNGFDQKAIAHLKIAESFFAERQRYLMHILSSNELGQIYLKNNEFDSCLIYLEKGLHSAEASNNVERCADYHKRVANYYCYRYETKHFIDGMEPQDMLQEAVSECQQGLHLLKEVGGRLATSKRYELYDQLSQSYFDLQQYDSCILYCNLVLDILNGNKYRDPYEQNKRLYNAYKSIGDEENAARFADVLVNREVDEAEKQKAVDEVKNAYDKKLELQRLESEQQLKRYRLYLWIAMLVIGLMVVLWGALRYRKKKEEETLKLQEAQHQLKDELEQQSSQQKKMLQQHVMTIYQTEQKDKLERITEAFESAYPKALEKMRSAYPNLNESECRVVMLSFLGFRAKETADILGLTENTAMKYRSNIRKKVGNDPISDLL